MARLFGTDGVRGTYGQDLTDDIARGLGHAAAAVLGRDHPKPQLLIGRDTRASGPTLERALAAGIAAAGGEAFSAGVIPTAAIAYLVHDLGMQAGVVISASHNPARDNGIKFFGPDGMKLPDAIEDDIEAAMDGDEDPPAQITDVIDAEDRYVDFLLEGIPSLEGLRVVVDCANGASCNVAPEVYRMAGADVHVIAADPDGTNINDHCGSTHPELLQQAVKAFGAHVGIAHDGDADRLIAVDEHAGLVDGDQILGINALDLKARAQLENDAVVCTVMSNLGFRRAMDENGVGLFETQVGDRYVLAAMLENKIVLGGEQSGHIVFLDRHTTGDGILTALRLMSVVARTGKGLSELAAQIPRYPQILLNVPVRDRHALEGAQTVWDAVHETEASMAGSGRVLVRASGTEPVVRVMAEASTEQAARDAVDHISAVVTAALG
ncbi:MAG TPA: phosphoglucosamine mutase [Actinomycetota bacterium]|nr:phosphoglucosamine mutase [Actinomycetota bacterium]